MRNRILEAINEEKIIMAVKNEKQLNEALTKKNRVIFLLYGDIITLPQTIQRIQHKRKFAVVHTDLIQGFGNDPIVVPYCHDYLHADGIISTHRSVIHKAKSLHLFSIYRFFLIDSISRETMEQAIHDKMQPDMYEILPGRMAYQYPGLEGNSSVPVIAGGLIQTKEDVEQVLENGASAVSTSAENLWK